ncbi:helix-turn-helix transcriptional regulator [Vallitalea pronyensis]|uniref:Helix-turn-helix transcriptional regulator n=1 Tax=Vallitalea pronyensis TaxID=1348613 RepID=A0A8J8MIK4_9FIRM|nr:AraC family transcriptional regulator [Vallitalea pronyensis]QUI22176.1 helix-turn-helix transcriptional regulator [Vallitalea pronyensis]
MDHPVKWQDSYVASKHITILTGEQLKIPGVRVFGKQHMTSAVSPLSTHYHENAYEFVLVSEGSFTFTVGDETYDVSGGDVFLSFPNELHSTAQSPLSLGGFFWIQLDISVMDNFLFLSEEARGHLIEALSSMTAHVIKAENSALVSLCKKTFKLALENEAYAAASHFVYLIYAILEASKKISSVRTEDIQQVINYIHDHVTHDISLYDLAHLSNLSLSHFKQKFKKQIGVSPRNYINIQKIELAKKLLKEGKSKTETAMLLGFNTSSYFSSVFKKYTTKTPSEYTK